MTSKFIESAVQDSIASALPYFDSTEPEDTLCLLALSDEDDDLSEIYEEKISNILLQQRVWVDADPTKIDQYFSEHQFDILESLIRLEIEWEHQDFDKAPEALIAWLDGEEDRISILRGTELWEEMSSSVRCAIDPMGFSHRVFSGEDNISWIKNSKVFTDVLCRLGGSSWTQTLAILSSSKEGKEAFSIAGEFALYGSIASELAENSNDFYHFIAEGGETFDEAFSLIYAVYEEKDDQKAFIQSAAVEILRGRGEPYPRIDGAPFSGSYYDAWDIEEAQQIFNAKPKNPGEEIRRARLLSDLRDNHIFEEIEIDLSSESTPFFHLLQGPNNKIFELACKDNIEGFSALNFILHGDWSEDHVTTLLSLLSQCSLYRVDYLRERIAQYYLNKLSI